MSESGQTDKHDADQPSKDKTPVKGDSGKDQAKKQPQKQAEKPAKKRTGRGAVVFALFALLVALGSALGVAAMWYLGEKQVVSMSDRVATVERGLESNVQDVVLPKLQGLTRTQSELQRSVAKQREALKQLGVDLIQSRVQLGELSEKIEGGRRRWRLLEIEDLLLAANERLLLYKDPGSAQQALKLASRRLGELNDPRLFGIRERVINEIAALNALPKPDIQGMVLSLSSLIEQVPKMPLAKRVASDFQAPDSQDELRLPEEPWRHFLDSMKTALSTMVTIRREKSDYKPLMPPEEKFFLTQNLQLKLQAARLSLLQRESLSYNAALAEAQEWLQTYFDTNDPLVAGAIQSIGQIQKIQFDWEPPTISNSLEALRKYLQAQSNPGTEAKADKQADKRAPAKTPAAKTGTDAADAATGSE